MARRTQLPKSFWSQGEGAALLRANPDDMEVARTVSRKYHVPVTDKAVYAARKRLKYGQWKKGKGMVKPTGTVRGPQALAKALGAGGNTWVQFVLEAGAELIGDRTIAALRQLKQERDTAVAEIQTLKDQVTVLERRMGADLKQQLLEKVEKSGALAVSGD